MASCLGIGGSTRRGAARNAAAKARMTTGSSERSSPAPFAGGSENGDSDNESLSGKKGKSKSSQKPLPRERQLTDRRIHHEQQRQEESVSQQEYSEKDQIISCFLCVSFSFDLTRRFADIQRQRLHSEVRSDQAHHDWVGHPRTHHHLPVCLLPIPSFPYLEVRTVREMG